jgi:hypothetical protein
LFVFAVEQLWQQSLLSVRRHAVAISLELKNEVRRDAHAAPIPQTAVSVQEGFVGYAFTEIV